MQLRWGSICVVACCALGIVGCGGGGSSSTSANRPQNQKRSRPRSASDCVTVWNEQEAESRLTETLFPADEGEFTAWVSIYEGRPVGQENPVSGLVEHVTSGDCLVVIPGGEGGPVAWSYDPKSELDFWYPMEESTTGPLYEFGSNSQAATRAEIIKNGRLRLVG